MEMIRSRYYLNFIMNKNSDAVASAYALFRKNSQNYHVPFTSFCKEVSSKEREIRILLIINLRDKNSRCNE